MTRRFPEPHPVLEERYRAEGWWREFLSDTALFEAAFARPEATALVDRLGSLCWGALAGQVDACAAGLQDLGVEPGEVVSWILPNWREAAISHWAILRVGAVSNPIVPIYRAREVRYILEQAATRVVFAPASFRGFDYVEMLDELRDGLASLTHVVTVGDEGGRGDHVDFEKLCQTRAACAVPDRQASDPALLLYTSGTTADPKGVVHTHQTLDVELRTMIDFYGLDARTVVYMPSPLSHVTGLLYGIQMPAVLQGSVVYQDRFEAGEGLGLIARHGCTFSVGATPFLRGLCDAQRAQALPLSLETFVCGGADVPSELIRDAQEVLGCLATRAYGSSEFPTVTGGNAEDSEAHRAETDGRVMAHCEVRVVDEAGNEVAPGAAGELLARGPELFPGYLAGVDSKAIDEAGWFATGDLVSIRDGYLTVEGRIKDIIIRGGENIAVKEVEDLLFSHPDLDEVAIVAMPDPVLTERACAWVVPKAGRSPRLEDLVNFLAGFRLAKQKWPERLELVDSLPKTASGKVQKHVLRARIAARLEEEGAAD